MKENKKRTYKWEKKLMSLGIYDPKTGFSTREIYPEDVGGMNGNGGWTRQIEKTHVVKKNPKGCTLLSININGIRPDKYKRTSVKNYRNKILEEIKLGNIISCVFCGRILTEKSLITDHKFGREIDDFQSACQQCNTKKRTFDNELKFDIDFFEMIIKNLFRNNKREYISFLLSQEILKNDFVYGFMMTNPQFVKFYIDDHYHKLFLLENSSKEEYQVNAK